MITERRDRPQRLAGQRAGIGLCSRASRRSVGMVTLRDDIAHLQSRLEEAERNAHQLPHGEECLLLVTSFMRRTSNCT
jgi:arginine/ornithine N-succinyltransferase beta subunit